MAVVRKKQDDRNLKILRELVTSGGGNRQCFDCGQKGPTYVNMTIGSFVCTRCSGVLRGLTPPHRVKSISMATFTQDEIEFLKSHGNDVCAKTWLGLWDPKRVIHQDQRELMIDKYERKRYYLEPASPLKSLTNTTPKLSNNLSNGSCTTTNNNNNNNNHLNNNTNGISIKNSLDSNNYKNITLTPPSSLRITANGTLGGGGGIATTLNNSNSHRQNNRFNFQNQFTPNENGLHNTNHTSSTLMNGFNGIGNSTSVNNHMVNKNSLNIMSSVTNPDKSHSFTPDSDFVADFGSANIFNATTTAVASASANNPLNGFKAQQNQQHQHLHNNGISSTVGKATITTNGIQQQPSNGFAVNGNSTNHSDIINANENFADFDHAPIIYNAAGLPMLNSTSNSLSSSATFNNSNSSINSTPPADRYAALKDLDEQLRESKAAAAIDTFSSVQVSQPNVNPFNTSPPTQPQQIGNPFQTAFNQTTNIFGTPPQAATATNAFSTNATFGNQPISAAASAFNNGFVTQQPTMIPNGCNLRFGTQQIATGNSVTSLKNPFTASSLNSNNPFL